MLLAVGNALFDEMLLRDGKLAVVEPIVRGETVELVELGADFATFLRAEEREGGEDLGLANRCGN